MRSAEAFGIRRLPCFEPLSHLRAIFRGLEPHLVLGESLRVFSVRVEARASAAGALRTVEAVLVAPVVADRPFQITAWRER